MRAGAIVTQFSEQTLRQRNEKKKKNCSSKPAEMSAYAQFGYSYPSASQVSRIKDFASMSEI